MTKTMHSTISRRQTLAGTAVPKPAETEHSIAPSNFIDPTTLPDEYAMRVRGDCLAPAIKGGDAVLVDQRQPYSTGDLVCVFLKPECSGGSTNVGLKRLVMNMMPGVTYPYQAHPNSNIMPVLVCEQDNPHRQYTIAADKILAVHRCMGLVPADVALHDPETLAPRYKRAVSAGWSRRELLAGAVSIVPAAGLTALPGMAIQAPDPISAAIEAHRAAGERLNAVCAREDQLEQELPKEARQSDNMMDEITIVETDDPRWIEVTKAWRETIDACDELAWALVESPPTTTAGAAALLAYVEDASEGWFPEGCIPALSRALAKAGVRIAGGAS